LSPEYFSNLPSLASKVLNEVIDTNLSVTDALSLAILFQGMSQEDITYMQIPGQDGYALDPLVKKELFYWIPDQEGLVELSNLFNDSKPVTKTKPPRSME
jgi:anionic cell wall polymer biosynthesis LytR-Cps2A-Psr (LCP) family protein